MPRFQVRVVIPGEPAAEMISVDVEALDAARARDRGVEQLSSTPGTPTFTADTYVQVRRYAGDGMLEEQRVMHSVRLPSPLPSRIKTRSTET
jgi:hypothetical protein